MNERKTEDLVQGMLRVLGYYDNKNIVIEKQQSENPRIHKLLGTASKSGKGRGYPEFLLSFQDRSDLIIIIECKADVRKHQSKERNKYKEYAVDGVRLYSGFLSTEFDVLAIAVSGETTRQLRISHFLQLRGSLDRKSIFGDHLLSYDDYVKGVTEDEGKSSQEYDKLLTYTKKLNQTLHTNKIEEGNRCLLISGILICLDNIAFKNSYKHKTNAQELVNLLVNTIAEELHTAKFSQVGLYTLVQSYGFIKTHKTLSGNKAFVLDLINAIDENINNFMKTYKYYDFLGEFYVEFLRYANNDKGLGIVLTPKHITELFCDIAKLDENSVVYDNCCGTGGFLITAMRRMLKKALGDQGKELHVREKQLIGIEYQSSIFPLVCSNMIIHQDGKTNILHGDCFSIPEEKRELYKSYKPTIGFLNPPYKTSPQDHEEFEFVLNNLDMLEKGGICVAILPMRCALYQKGTGKQLKERILKKHTLEAVFSMPDDLFHNSKVSVVTCVMVFTAHHSHDQKSQTFFGYLKDDGFVKRKHKGRVDNGTWHDKKETMLSLYRNKRNTPGLSVTQQVEAKDEWCVEAYMETDYSQLAEEDFVSTIKNYLAYEFLNDRYQTPNYVYKGISNVPFKTPVSKENLIPMDREWKSFTYDEIFNIYGGFYNRKPEPSIKGTLPFIGATESDNGVSSWHTREQIETTTKDGKEKNHHIEKKIFKGGEYITVSNNGSVGCAFYQKIDFTCSHDVNVLELKGTSFNAFIALFICSLITLEQFRWAYGRKWRPIRMPKSIIKLPVNRTNNPDWQLMEDYIKSLPYSSNL